MPVINCPHCDAKYNLPDRLIGRRVKCRKCNLKFDTGDEYVGGMTQDLAAVNGDPNAPGPYDFQPAGASSDTSYTPATGPIPPPPPRPSAASGSDSFAFAPPPPSRPKSNGMAGSLESASAADSEEINLEAAELARALAGDSPHPRPGAVELPTTRQFARSDDILPATDSQGIQPYSADTVRASYDREKAREYGGTGEFDPNAVLAQAQALKSSAATASTGAAPSAPSADPRVVSGTPTAPTPLGPAAPTPILVLGLVALVAVLVGGAYLILFQPALRGSGSAPRQQPPPSTAVRMDGLTALDFLIAADEKSPEAAVRRVELFFAQSRALQIETAIRHQALALAAALPAHSGNAEAGNGGDSATAGDSVAAAWRHYRAAVAEYQRFLDAHRHDISTVTVQALEPPETAGETTTLTVMVKGVTLDPAVGVALPALMPWSHHYRYTLTRHAGRWHVKSREPVTSAE